MLRSKVTFLNMYPTSVYVGKRKITYNVQEYTILHGVRETACHRNV